jgi:GNAT superfamily N-acetyltransferase
VAEVDGEPASAVSSFDPQSAGWAVASEAMTRVQSGLGWTETDRAASYQRVAPVWACFLPDIGADWGVEHIATRPSYRGRGLAGMLVNRASEEAREHGRRLVQITTYLGNHSAQRAYEKCGFRVSDQKRCSEMEALLGTPGFLRLVRDV